MVSEELTVCCLHFMFVLMQAHIWGLDRQLDKFTTDYVQQHLQRGSHGLLTLSELDFAFPPNVSPAMIIQARLKGHASISSAGLSPVNLVSSKSSATKGSKLAGGIGWLREVRVLQDPNPRLHNFPEVLAACFRRLTKLPSCSGGVCDLWPLIGPAAGCLVLHLCTV